METYIEGEFEAYDWAISYIRSYHPYWVNNEVNPSFEKETDGRLLDLKECKEGAINYFYNLVYNLLYDLPEIRNYEICVVPSSKSDNKSTGMHILCSRLASALGKKDYSGVLDRYIDIEKLATGGNRNPNVHYDSITVADEYVVEDKKFILLDDVTTTGGSLAACANILIKAGADEVACLAIGKTTWD